METLSFNQSTLNPDIMFTYFMKLPSIDKENFLLKVLTYTNSFQNDNLDKVLKKFNNIKPNTDAKMSMDDIVNTIHDLRKLNRNEYSY